VKRKLLSTLTTATVVAVMLPAAAASAAPTADDPLPIAAAAVGQTEPDGTVSPMIIGGVPATQVYKGVASMQYLRNGNPDWHTCGVVLWTPTFASTNAHCVTNADATSKDPSIYKLRFNTINRKEGGVLTGARSLTIYPTWAWGTNPPGTVQGDMAMIELTTPVLGLPTVLPPVSGPWKVRPGKPARIIGWGFTRMPWDEVETPTMLSQLDTYIVEPKHCAVAAIDAGEVCVMDPDNPAASACYGDSSSPVMTRGPKRNTWLAIGTASRETSTDCTGAVVYTNLSYYRDWALQVITGRYKAPKTPEQPPTGSRPAYRWAGCGTAC